MIWVAVAVAGALGAACRYVLDYLVSARIGGVYPWGTTLVNVTGSLLAGGLAGVVASATLPAELYVPVAGGFLGAYTTFSTAMYETVRLLEDGEPVPGTLNLVLPLAISIVVATAGFVLVSR